MKKHTIGTGLILSIIAGNVYAQDIEKLTLGQKLYENNCGKCHVLHNPESFTSESWLKITARMFPKTNLDKNEQKSVLNYLTNNGKK